MFQNHIFRPGTPFGQYAQKQLTALTRANYLAMENHGASERVCTLTQKGRQALADMDIIARPRIKNDPERQQLFMRHTHTITPDGLTIFRVLQRASPIAWEVDMGTEEWLDQWLPKIRRLMAYNRGVFQEQFSYDGFRVAVYVRSKRQSSRTRLQTLLKWTEDELIVQKRLAWGSFFLFTVAECW